MSEIANTPVVSLTHSLFICNNKNADHISRYLYSHLFAAVLGDSQYRLFLN